MTWRTTTDPGQRPSIQVAGNAQDVSSTTRLVPGEPIPGAE
jgi:hypothetical protein